DLGAIELHPQSVASARDAGRAFTFANRETDAIAARAHAHRVLAVTCLEPQNEGVLAAVGPPGVEPLPWRPWVGGRARARRRLFAQAQEFAQRGECENALGRGRRRRKKRRAVAVDQAGIEPGAGESLVGDDPLQERDIGRDTDDAIVVERGLEAAERRGSILAPDDELRD